MTQKKKIIIVLIISLVIILIGAGFTTFFIYKSNKEKNQVANKMYEQEMEEKYDNIVVEFDRIKNYLNQFKEFYYNNNFSGNSVIGERNFMIYAKTFEQQVDIKDFENRRMDLEDRVNNLVSPTKEMRKVDIAFKRFFETYKDVQMNFTDFNEYDYKIYTSKMDRLEDNYHQANTELLEHRKKVIERRIYGK